MTTQYLPPGMRCTAFWYAQAAGLLPYGGPSDPEDRDFLAELGLRAARLARWHGIPERKAAEGPFWVHQWPETIWAQAADWIVSEAAGHGELADFDPVTGRSGWDDWSVMR